MNVNKIMMKRIITDFRLFEKKEDKKEKEFEPSKEVKKEVDHFRKKLKSYLKD